MRFERRPFARGAKRGLPSSARRYVSDCGRYEILFRTGRDGVTWPRSRWYKAIAIGAAVLSDHKSLAAARRACRVHAQASGLRPQASGREVNR